MKRLHIAINSHDIVASVADYTQRLGQQPCLVVPGEYALWRTDQLNFSLRHDPDTQPGSMRHLGWEDPEAMGFSASTDCNGIVWEHFNAADQADEIALLWPDSDYNPNDCNHGFRTRSRS